MRSAKANDYWKDVYSDPRRYTNYIDELNFTNCNGFSENVKIAPGLTAICGLNGVGKSSVISAIVKLLGIEDDSAIRKNKFQGEIRAQLLINRNIVSDISESSSAIKNGLDSDLIHYIDSDLAIDCIKYWEQENVPELLEGVEDYEFTAEQLKELNQIVGKEYSECISYNIEDSGQSFTPVYFKIKTGNIEYSSQEMGIGEHFLLYIYHIMREVKSNSIVIIEEPESYISIHSQKNLLNYIAKIISEKSISVILTTHSPFILSRVNPMNIRMITNRAGKMKIQTPNKLDVTDKLLGMDYKVYEKIINYDTKIATLFVEDYAARLFLSYILKQEAPDLCDRVDVVSLNGESEITKILEFDIGKHMAHRIIGVYDGDMLSKASSKKIDEKAKLPYCFLPINQCIEIEIQEFVKSEDGITALQEELDVDSSLFYAVLESLEGEDHHDWFLELCKKIDKKEDIVIEAFYNVWCQSNEEEIQKFVKDIQEKVSMEIKIPVTN